MKKSWLAIAAVIGMFCLAPQARGAEWDNVDPAYKHASDKALEEWRDLKYGLRIHWGLYSMLGVDASWPLKSMKAQKRQEYFDLYKKFNPTDFDAEKWMDLFDRDGLKCFAFTTKHHDGFSMFDTKARVKRRVNWGVPDAPKVEDCDVAFSIMETPFKRDIVKELTDAAQKHHIAYDLYFSHIDWYDADFRMDPLHLIYSKTKVYNKESDPESYARFVARHRQQIMEIVSNYGKVDMICLDIQLPDFCWADVKETVMMARAKQPDVMFRDRGIGAYGDYNTPENWIPEGPADKRVTRPWMVIYTLANQFAFERDGKKYKSGKWILYNLVDIVSKGGNFMPSIGPDEKGNFHPEAIKQLDYVGDWLKVNGEAIFKTRPRTTFSEIDDNPAAQTKEYKTAFTQYLREQVELTEPQQKVLKDGAHKDVRFTRSKDMKTVYAIALNWPGETLSLRNVTPRPGSEIRMLGVNDPLKWHTDDQGGLVIEIPTALQDEAKRPCKQAWAFKIEAQGEK